MNSYPFKLLDGGNLILIEGFLDDDKMLWALDTAASHTIVDLTKLVLAGYSISDFAETNQFETGKGIIEAHSVQVKSISVLGITWKQATVSVYDFLANGIVSEYDGLLGLDLFLGRKICIDFRKMVIDVS